MTAASATEGSSDGPVLSLMNKRLRALKKKYNRILQMEESKAQGKPLNKEQEEVLNSKAVVAVLIDEYEKFRQPLSIAVQEELSLFTSSTVVTASSSSSPSSPRKEQEKDQEVAEAAAERVGSHTEPSDPDTAVEDLLNLLYFGCLFDVKQQGEFTSTMVTRTHERGCCLTYDYVTDDATDLLGERDLDLISSLGSLVLSRPAHASVSHKSALLGCLEHAKHWLRNSDQPIEQGSAITYVALRQRLDKILASDYFTTTPEFKAPDDVAAAVGKYATCQMQVTDSPQSHNVLTESPLAHNQQKDDDDQENIQGKGITSPNQSTSTDEPQMDEIHDLNLSSNTAAAQEEQQKLLIDEEQSQEDTESKEQQYMHRRTYQNQRGGGRGGGGGRRGYANGRGGRGGRGGGGYQNGRSQYYDPGYYPRNYYNTRGRGGGRGGGSGTYNANQGVAAAPSP